jgi:EAL domain-containing protein (putative c-di-GMP-specific phosphodiesterase class I)/GGDEF domain-containing protein
MIALPFPKRPRFKKLSTELALIYAALFGVVLLIIAGAVYVAIENNSRDAVKAEMTASSAVFDRLWKLRADQLSSTAGVLSRDFGFRQAVATGDKETILSALDNIQSRVELDTAFIVDLDGNVVSRDDGMAHSADPALMAALNSDPDRGGVLMLKGAPYQAVAAPVKAPTLIGWVVFAQRLGDAELGELEKLSAIPLNAHLYVRAETGAWTSMDGPKAKGIAVNGDELAKRAFRESGRAFIRIPENDSIAGVKSLRSFTPGVSAALLLEYSMKDSQAKYRSMLIAIMGIGGVGLIALLIGSWFVSRGVTGPISALHGAASRLAAGGAAEVKIAGRNEIAELAANFNAMSAEIAAREKRIIHLARHDNETGLPNRSALDDRLAVIRTSHNRSRIFGVSVAIDRFHQVRSAIGNALSARLIAEVAGGISHRFSEVFVGRVTSGTIGVVFHADSMDAAKRVAAMIGEAASQPVRLGADRIDVLATVGLACDADDADLKLSLLERAEVAIGQARVKRVRVAAFDRKAYGDPAAALSLMSGMIAGLDRGELFLAHQPKLDLRSGRIASAESLLRWKHPERGMIPPDAFIGMAEETGHIRPLTDWVLDRAIADQRVLRAAGWDMPLSVNVSGRLIANEDFAARALRQIRRANANICFEITETAVIDNPQLAIEIMKELSEAGVGLSIDDYGSGLSSLSYLRSIPAKELKIDRMFVQTLAHGSSDALLVKSTIDLAHSLGMTITAEGVETAESLAILQAMGADTAQGYYVARPMPLDGLLDFLKQPLENLPAQANVG